MDHGDFDSVSWRNDPDSDNSRPATAESDVEETQRSSRDVNGKRRMSSTGKEPETGPLVNAMDLTGIGDGILECTVDTPLKENDGTKDAYVSYLITTHVGIPQLLYGPT
jgi:sorting nexin-4